jgi:hypothetical protein
MPKVRTATIAVRMVVIMVMAAMAKTSVSEKGYDWRL